ncbi:amino-acid N-acetyltransferase [Solemya velum gill symbiont]|uniref:Amino-acid acetyltransferase n=1 Tax=Solemya velum gill symbiont TaxID=2340 RepID=A0A0B0HC70_SOVGS|nr:amino-acid N-acetyltransferase [Solemya velum gill symbiont]
MGQSKQVTDNFINWFRTASPYVHAHRGATLVLAFGGSAVADDAFPSLVHDIALLQGLGIRLVLVHGSRPQIEERLKQRKASMTYVNGLRVTDETAITCVKEAAGSVRIDVEALLSTASSNSPMAGVRIRVASGNFVTAKPIGVRDGTDYLFTGEVRRIDTDAITHQLDAGNIVLLPPLGYSSTGEVFNLSTADVAQSVAAAIGADKLILLGDDKPLKRAGKLLQHLTPTEVDQMLTRRKSLTNEQKQLLQTAASACRKGVKRAHLLSRTIDGVVLKELFTRDGAGTMISAKPFDTMRTARADDVVGILALIEPLEKQGALVRRSRELIENEVSYFSVIEREGVIIACAALYPYAKERMAEIACVAVHPEYRGAGFGETLLHELERKAEAANINRLFVLTTSSSHWFGDQGFKLSQVQSLPMAKRGLYNYRRNSRVLVKEL